MDRISGIYQLAGCSLSHSAQAVMHADGQVVVTCLGHTTLHQAGPAAYEYSDLIPGLPVDLIFADGARFIPQDVSFCWPHLSRRSTLPAWLESHWIVVVIAAAIVPLFFWWMTTRAIPWVADVTAVWIPDEVTAELSQQTLMLLDKAHFDVSEVTAREQQVLQRRWQLLQEQVGLPPGRYQLYFRKTDQYANAFALPDGSVIVTDGMVDLMAEEPQLLTAILLHEIGHVEHRHGLKSLIQSSVTTFLFAVMLGETDGLGELFLGAGAGLIQSAYSRDMETEADAFAHLKLEMIRLSPMVFADAMRRLMVANGGTLDETGMKYFSSHPDIQERINIAAAKQPH